jgi:hypothetical protein
MLLTRATGLEWFSFRFVGRDRDPVKGLLTAQWMQELPILAWLNIRLEDIDAANYTPTFGSTYIVPGKWMSHAGTHACSHVMLRTRTSVRQVIGRRNTEYHI